MIILHVPHDSTHIPAEYRNDFLLDDDQLAREIIAMTDSHTDELYDYDRAEKVVFPVSRLLVDPERFTDDNQEVMAKRGMGVLYEVTSTLSPLRAKPSQDLRQKILDQYYFPHHDKLTAIVQSNIHTHGRCLIIDCHSFPSRPLAYEMIDNQDLRAEICIGTDGFHTPPWITKILKDFFENKGYSVSVDDPFEGALVPMQFYNTNDNVMSVMYEIRRDLYMDETTGQKNGNFPKMQKDITDSIRELESQLTNQ
jgi:N-formylglutamate amidohydrolase